MKVDVRNLPVSDLVALFQFVASKPFSTNEQAKRIIKERLAEIEKELMDRAFGGNPYEAKKPPVQQVEKGMVVVKYEGQDPTQVLSQINLLDIKDKEASDHIAQEVAKTILDGGK